ncbi:hypothetical protein [Amycolatopsis sp. FDAARGOS 1241]|uniref:hypothetical protein n=1 Tax=Amycolatopsis sp. FDAARGOS 1241 TaxID=2778070 RepID=UPI001EF21F9F|nr:hypothetical protein [Amycolatopsis sp. FDAARGOS 1241]
MNAASTRARAVVNPVIDYLDILLMGPANTGLTLVPHRGGTTYAWDSPASIGPAAGSVAAGALRSWNCEPENPCCRCGCSAIPCSPSPGS